MTPDSRPLNYANACALLRKAEAALEAKDGELERLREALERIAGSPKHFPLSIRAIADAALAPSTPTKEGE